jgi:hypothetical protein
MDFMTRKIAYLMKEQDNKSELFDTRNLDVEVVRTLEEPQGTEMHVPDDEEVLPLKPKKEYRQREVTISDEDKNQNGKRITETKLTGKKARKLSKKKAQIERLQKVPEGASQKEKLQNWSFVGISEQRHRALRRGEAI